MDCQYLTACTTHLGVSDVVKPVSKAWEGSAFLKGTCFPSPMPFCICFSEDFIYGFTRGAALRFDKDDRAQELKCPQSSSYPSPPLFDLDL